MTHDNIHSCSYECERPTCIKAQRDELAQRMFELVAEAVAAEREACAKVCHDYATRHGMKGDDNEKAQAWMMLQCAAAIRARGQ
jgi:hypothetical protein